MISLPKVARQLSGLHLSGSHLSALHLSIRTARSATDARSFIAYQYASYPFRLSGNLRIDPSDPHRVYAYIMNASPGILSGDNLRLVVEVGDRSSLYLSDQSATKAHSRPPDGAVAQINWEVQVGAGAYFEYAPEPLILFKSAALVQNMQITLHPQGRMMLGEIIVPGRMARGEFYAFEALQNRLWVQTPEGRLCFADNLHLLGQANRFKHSAFLTDFPIMGNFIAVVPGIALDQLVQALQGHGVSEDQLQVSDSPLPGCNGLLVRAIATQVSALKAYQRHLLSCVRQLTGHSPLPSIPK